MEYKTKISSRGSNIDSQRDQGKYGYREGVEVIFKPISETKLLIERTPKLSELFGYLGNAEATKNLHQEREKELKAKVKNIEKKNFFINLKLLVSNVRNYESKRGSL